MDKNELRQQIEQAINYCSAENGCDTPDFILAQYLVACLDAFDAAVNQRREWWGDKDQTGFGTSRSLESRDDD